MTGMGVRCVGRRGLARYNIVVRTPVHTGRIDSRRRHEPRGDD